MKLLVLLLFGWICSEVDAQERTFLVVAPLSFRLDASEKVVLQVFGFSDPVKVYVSLKKTMADRDIVQQQVTLSATNQHMGEVQLRLLPTDVDDKMDHVILNVQSNAFQKDTRVPLSRVNGFLVVQTDKPLYTPRQSVKVRAFSLNQELRPADRSVFLTFRDPDYEKVAVVEVKDVSNGMPSLQNPFKIPLNPKLGIWTLEASYIDHFRTTASTTFEVREYVLPSFTITIKPTYNYVSHNNFRSFPFKVTAKYLHGAPVSEAEIFIRYGYVSGKSPVIIPSTVTLDRLSSKGELDVNVDLHQVFSRTSDPKTLSDLKNKNLYIAVLVKEDTGGISEEAELKSVKFVQSPYTLELISTPPFIKPGLPYYIQVLVKDPLGEPVPGVPVRLVEKQEHSRGRDPVDLRCSTDSYTTGNKGIAFFGCNTNLDTITINLRIVTNAEALPADSQASHPLTARSYESPNNRYLYINPEPIDAAVGSWTQVTVFSLAPNYLSVRSLNYLIMSKGKVVKYGWVEFRRGQDNTHILSFQVTKEMVPSIRLLVYYMPYGESTAELVADAVWLNIKGECANGLQTELKVSGTVLEPQQQLQMDVTVNQVGYIAMTAVDTGIYSLRPNYKDPVDMVLRLLESADQGCGGGGGANAADVFRLAGLSFMTNANAGQTAHSESCQALVRPKRALSAEKRQKILATFPDSLKKWCEGGLNYSPSFSTCEKYAKSRFHKFPVECQEAFAKCCVYNQKNGDPNLTLGKSELGGDFGKIPTLVRSYFPESWLWQVKKITQNFTTLTETLPDSLTTWHIKTVGIFDKGICVAKTAEVSVDLPVSVNVPLPYQIVRGEQVELSGSVYNRLNDPILYCVTLTVEPQLCLVDSVAAADGSQRRSTTCDGDRTRLLGAGEVGDVKFTLMALEDGQHKLTFKLITAPAQQRSLSRTIPRDTLVKELTVVPEGELYEEKKGSILDPKGLYGTRRLSVVLNSAVPQNIVPNTKVQRMLTINGEILDQWVSVVEDPEGIRKLLSLPSGTAASELGGLLVVLHVYQYLENTQRWNILGPNIDTSSSQLKQQLIEGVAGLAMFKRRDGSYGMFKTHESSTWVTAVAVRTLASVHHIVPVDLDSLTRSANWLFRNAQSTDNSFRETSTQYTPNNVMRLPDDDVEKKVYLTATVMVALKKAMETKYEELQLKPQEDKLSAARKFVSRNIQAVRSVYVLSVAAYALTLHDPNDASTVQLLQRLEGLARKRGNPPELMYWQEENVQMEWIKPDQKSGQTVETTAYVLLSFVLKGWIPLANPIVKWLTQDQHYGGAHFNAQDTLMTLEAVSEYCQSAPKAELNQHIKLEFPRETDLNTDVHLHNRAPVAPPVLMSKNSPVTAETALGSGVSHVKLKTVYYRTVPPPENCFFDIKLELLRSGSSDGKLGPHLTACAQYRPPPNELVEESLPTIMEIQLPSGLEPLLDDLRPLMEGERPIVATYSYSLKERRVIVQLFSVPSQQFLCVGFRVRTAFVVGETSGTVFKVYEEQDPGSICSKEVSDQEQKIQRLCQYNQCQCVTAVCSTFRGTVDPGKVTAETLKQEICRPQVKYAFKVKVKSVTSEGDFSVITATVVDILKRAPEFNFVSARNEVDFIKKATCNSVDVQTEQQYLIAGTTGLEVVNNDNYRFRFPLDSEALVQIWPENCGPECQALLMFTFLAQTTPC